MLNRSELHDEQLLDGVAMTTSISCSAQEFIEEYEISEESSEELEITLIDGSEERLSNCQPEGSFSHRPRLTETIKTKSRSRSQRKVNFSNCAKTSTKKTWQTIFELNDNLFEVHYLGILQHAQSVIDKLNQFIITEEYSKLKVFEKELIEIIREIEFGLNQYEKQKKSLINQIDLLKSDNEHLNCTINELHTVIEDLEKTVGNYFERNELDKYIGKVESEDLYQSQTVPFARTFSHSLEEISLMKLIEEDAHSKSIPISQFCIFILDLKKQSENLLAPNYSSSIQSNCFVRSFDHSSTITTWIDQIVENFTDLYSRKSTRQNRLYSNNWPCQEKKSKVIEVFLNKLSANRNHFLRKIESSPQKSLQLWHVIHTSMVTFFGILIQQTLKCEMQLSFGNHTTVWTKVFQNELQMLIRQSNIQLSDDLDRYFNRIERFMADISELVVFRMLRNDA